VMVVPEAVVLDETPKVAAGTTVLQRFRRIGVYLAIIDISCLALALVAAHTLRFGSLPDSNYLMGIAAACLLWVGVFHALGLYAPHNISRFEEFRRTVSAAGIGLVVIILLTFWFELYISRSWMAITLAIVLVMEVSVRSAVRAIVGRLQADGTLALRTLVVGSEEQGAELLDALEVVGSGFMPVGCVDAGSPFFGSRDIPTAEKIDHLRALLRRYQADCLFATSPIGTNQMFLLMRAARQEGVVLRVFTQLPGILTSRVTLKPVGSQGVALTLKPSTLSPSQSAIKRAMDLVLSMAGLIVVSPILLVVAIAIKATSRGPVLFRQERVTEGGRIFRMFKFRTMTEDSRRHVEEQEIDTSAPYFKLKDDPRLTKLGKWLREWSIDELPQLFNVVIGDMSLVGPRPLPSDQVAANIELLGPRHEVRAGITGWWQIQGRADVDAEGAIAKDDFYIENWSPTLDLFILLRTAAVVFTRRGAY
jgi:exopolysaccharide biosynthesis polyprenyl glycosylphosphotransferase